MNKASIKREIKECTIGDVKTICAWRYKAPYDQYNYPPYETVVKQGWAIADGTKRKEQFHSVYKQDTLFGYFRIWKENESLLLGIGLNPDRCGNGEGNHFMELILAYIRKNYGTAVVRVEVRKFNKRAIRCYEKAGFTVVDSYIKRTLLGEDEFVRMEWNN